RLSEGRQGGLDRADGPEDIQVVVVGESLRRKSVEGLELDSAGTIHETVQRVRNEGKVGAGCRGIIGRGGDAGVERLDGMPVPGARHRMTGFGQMKRKVPADVGRCTDDEIICHASETWPRT